jgi:hypothetical protein
MATMIFRDGRLVSAEQAAELDARDSMQFVHGKLVRPEKYPGPKNYDEEGTRQQRAVQSSRRKN